MLGARRHRQQGQSLVEFSLVSILFFLLIFGIIDLGRLYFTQMTLQYAMREAGRFGVTGNHLPDPNNPGQLQTRVASIRSVAQRTAAGLIGIPTSVQVSSVSGGAGSAGGPDDTFTLTMVYDLRLITPIIGRFFSGGVYRITARTTFRNEPFPRSQTN